jgi:DNA invertase Pin-like site-specific DNA recombinase
MVELRGRLSNPVVREAVAMDRGGTDTAEITSPGPRRRWRLVDRLGEKVIRQLVADGRSGVSRRERVDMYGISMSSVKRILRR